MILYKYYGYDSGLAAIHSQQLGFREPLHFNDPFELTSLFNSSGAKSDQKILKKQVANITKTVGILSLTRRPDNPLMWSHYGQSHSGFVVGYKVDIPFLNSSDYNLITVDNGSLNYLDSKVPFNLDSKNMEAILEIYRQAIGLGKNNSNVELAKRLFLTKNVCWAYEEEVRVVKRLTDFSTSVAESAADPLRIFSSISEDMDPDDLPKFKFENGYMTRAKFDGLYLYEHQVDICEVYLGARNSICEMDTAFFTEQIRLNRKVYRMDVDHTSWNLKKTLLADSV